jgi:hypothetical protein
MLQCGPATTLYRVLELEGRRLVGSTRTSRFPSTITTGTAAPPSVKGAELELVNVGVGAGGDGDGRVGWGVSSVEKVALNLPFFGSTRRRNVQEATCWFASTT